MTVSPMLIGLLVGFWMYTLAVGLHRRAQIRARKTVLEETLSQFKASAEEEQEEIRRLQGEKPAPFTQRVGAHLEDMALNNRYGVSLNQWLAERLERAGYPGPWGRSVQDFIGWIATFGGAVVLGGGLLVHGGFPFLLYVLMVGLVLAYPFVMLRTAIRRRQEQAFAELPKFLDQVVLNLSSGTRTMDGALRRVVIGDGRTSAVELNRVLVQEFRRAYLENANQQRPFAEAYRAVSERLQVPEVSDLVEILVESQHGGGGKHVVHQLKQMSSYVDAIYEEAMHTQIKKADTPFTISTVMVMFSTAICIATPVLLTVTHALKGAN